MKLESAAFALRDILGPDYEAVKDVVEMNSHLDETDKSRSLRWLDEIPELAKECRRSEEASSTAA